MTLDATATPSYTKGYWLHRDDDDTTHDTPSHNSDSDSDSEDRCRERLAPPGPVENLKTDLQRHMHRRHRLGRSSQASALLWVLAKHKTQDRRRCQQCLYEQLSVRDASTTPYRPVVPHRVPPQPKESQALWHGQKRCLPAVSPTRRLLPYRQRLQTRGNGEDVHKTAQSGWEGSFASHLKRGPRKRSGHGRRGERRQVRRRRGTHPQH